MTNEKLEELRTLADLVANELEPKIFRAVNHILKNWEFKEQVPTCHGCGAHRFPVVMLGSAAFPFCSEECLFNAKEEIEEEINHDIHKEDPSWSLDEPMEVLLYDIDY